MGSDPALFMTNLLLCYFENKWILNLKRSKLHKACSFTKIFWFTDDLWATNDNGLIKKHSQEMYPEELKLKKENVSSNKIRNYLLATILAWYNLILAPTIPLANTRNRKKRNHNILWIKFIMSLFLIQ